MDWDTVKLKLEYLREVRLWVEIGSLTAAGKAYWLERASQVADSLERELAIGAKNKEDDLVEKHGHCKTH